MSRLIWKELREQRLIPLAYGLIMVAAVVLWYAFDYWSSVQYRPFSPPVALTPSATPILFDLGVGIAGLFSGSGAFAPEIGKGTLNFLAIFPTGRPRIWAAKLLVGIFIALVSMASMWLFFVLSITACYGAGGIGRAIGSDRSFSETVAAMSIIGLMGYAIANYVSTLVDRSAVASVLALVVGIALMAGGTQYISLLQIPSTSVDASLWFAFVLFVTVGLSFTIASYISFCTGGVRRTSGHAVRSCCFLAVSFAAIMLSAQAYAGELRRTYAHAQAPQADYYYGHTAVSVQFSNGEHYWMDEKLTVVFGRGETSFTERLSSDPMGYRRGPMAPLRRNSKSKQPVQAIVATRNSDSFVRSAVDWSSGDIVVTILHIPGSVEHHTVEALAANGEVLGKFDFVVVPHL